VLLAGFILSLLIVLPLRWINPPTTSFILRDKAVSNIDLRHFWVTLDQVSPSLTKAVIAAEDQKFFLHYGFDLKSLRKALQEKRKRSRGASTITQQLAKNLYLSANRSLLRKGTEAYLTILMELFWSKQRILELYINCVEFGPSVYGVGMASHRFFNKSANKITMQESSLLAAVLPSPKKMSAKTPSSYVKKRAMEIQNLIRYVPGQDRK
jgi:monofunctional biosynthetic peptidoglycan transglycosylase